MIALFHHPLDWLCEFDQQRCESLLDSSDGPHFRLRGHLHKARLRAISDPDRHYLEFAAGACHAGQNFPNGINIVKLDLNSGNGQVHLFRYID